MLSSKNNTVNLLYILSAPRSGSTVLTSLLDQYEGIFCLPESGFPQVLDVLPDHDFKNRSYVAALYQASCFGGSVLTLEETIPCVASDRRMTLINIGLASAEKLHRPISSISWIVWKTTRMVSWWKSLETSTDRFLVLHRDPQNVFESQFRVHFGLHNRNPWRFALFLRSYLGTFDLYPDSTFVAEYATLDSQLPKILNWLGSDSCMRNSGESALARVQEKFSFHSNILLGFENKDSEKVNQIDPSDLSRLRTALSITSVLPSRIALLLRRIADLNVWKKVRSDASRLIGRLTN